ncbi:formylglycine-generating enzyme family protein [Arenibacter sp. F26102]|uniref:formylglycine-generating enzyme family protein n=1 Tax=Arenibacter sp. F26102 TaxID=2926416 RepID=UPI001FF5A26C|nr:SUMF1/EgtB/PvdO family nonheme iron enzyme [Arenibacter sp. F26102]MCK0146446.1 formylglycine-generating enzyme family protein [Arenibacter sp. F26102]
MLRIASRVFNFLLVALLLISLESCKTGKSVAPEPDKKMHTAEIFTENIPVTDISFEMVLIPEGKFTMGSPEGQVNRKADEGPVKDVELDAFYMGKYELGWEVFELFFKQNKELFQTLDADRLNNIDAITRPSPPYEDPSYGMGKVGYPAISMSTYSALVFCKWLSTVTGRFYRLPTEAEWEYAAKAGTNTAYSFGDDVTKLDEYAVYYKNSNNQYAKVGSKLPNPWGLYDMHGNVSEWTLDEYKENAFAVTESKNPWVKPTVIHPRVIKGGSWDDDAKTLRSSARIASSLKLQKRDPQIPKSFWWNTDSNFIGFRLVSPIVQPSKEEQKQFWQTVLDE